MSDRKISELTNITGANLVDADEFVVVDISADETKAITLGELKEAFDAGSGFVRITGDTMTGDLTVPNVITSGNVDGRDVSADGTKLDTIETNADVTDTTNVTAAGALMTTGGTMTGDVAYGDNVKATFGSSADLEIYSDGFHSRIVESGSGNLKIQATDLEIINAANNEYVARFITDGACELRYDNATKLSTSTSGINVSGTVVADGLTVETAQGDISITPTSSSLNFARSGTNYIRATDASGNFSFVTGANDFATTRLKIADNGDISFYEDTGTTPKFFWDASAERLGIGTTVPRARLHASGVTGDDDPALGTESAPFFVSNTALSYGLNIGVNAQGDAWLQAQSNSSAIAYDILLNPVGGNVGIGTSSPASELHVADTGESIVTIASTSAGSARINMVGAGGGSAFVTSTVSSLNLETATSSDIVMRTGATERLRLYGTSGDLTMTGGGSIGWANWTITESGGSLYFATGGTNKMKLDASGNLDVVGSVNSNATIS